MKINRKKVHSSIIVPIVTVFCLLVLISLVYSVYYNNMSGFGHGITFCFWLMIIGTVFWFPSLLICLIIERIVIRENFTPTQLGITLFIEALIPFLLLNYYLGTWEAVEVLSTFSIAITAQACRWFYLKGKDRMFVHQVNKEPVEETKF